MEEEFRQVKEIFTHQIRLSLFDVQKRINIVTDGANSSGVGFVLFQNADDLKQGENVSIVKANSSGLKDCQKQYSRAHGQSGHRGCYPGGEELVEQIWISL